MKLTDSNLSIENQSLTLQDQVEYGLVLQSGGERRLAVLSGNSLPDFEGDRSELGGKNLIIGELSAKNASALRKKLNWLNPVPLGLATSAGMGDRIGLATPGHVRAVRAVGNRIAPIFAQQSMREMSRSGRTPRQVMDDATWGIFSEGWQGKHGADADHLKTTEDIDSCRECGYTFFTIDPGAFVDDRAQDADSGMLREMAALLPKELGMKSSGLLGKAFHVEGGDIRFDETTLLRAMVKYGKAVWHVVDMYRHLEKSGASRPFELEVSVDETNQPTSHAEHLYISLELKRFGVKWVSLAPRYVGRFEKGVDYIGDLALFEQDFEVHAAIAREFGPYKLSLHSGSDKFSIYPIANRLSKGQIHLKTAGTSYLEALRTIAALDHDLFREIYAFARERYPEDKASYHVSAEVKRTPLPNKLDSHPNLLDEFDAREILHVTFGSVLTDKTATGSWRFRDRIMDFLRVNHQAYAANLERHFIRHLSPFASK